MKNLSNLKARAITAFLGYYSALFFIIFTTIGYDNFCTHASYLDTIL